MNSSDANTIEALTEKVLAKRKYEHIHRGLIESIAKAELGKGRKKKETEKAVLGKLHQVGAAYFAQTPDYEDWTKALSSLPKDLHTSETKAYCRQIMKSHYSTEERLPIMGEFYERAFASIQPVNSILDLACGLNPLALPWMPVSKDVKYYGCDIFSDMAAFLNAFLTHFGVSGLFRTCNVLDSQFEQPAKAALILKTLPCLEQLKKGFIPRLLDTVPAEYILLSYPISSLSGKVKGMRETYSTQFNDVIEEKGWDYERFEFSSELAFLVQKP
jgi:16S rRNA (guanine(1405)-N(7))-methyltransferase